MTDADQVKRVTLKSIEHKTKTIKDATEHRAMMIRAAHKEGVSMRDIADAAGLGTMTVQRIINDAV